MSLIRWRLGPNKSIRPLIFAEFDMVDMKSLRVVAKSKVPLLPANGQLGVVLRLVDADDLHFFHPIDFVGVRD